MTAIKWIPAEPPDRDDPDAWPIVVDVEYDEDGPAIICNAYVAGVKGLPDNCRWSFHSSSIAELRADLIRHINHIDHVASPFLEARRTSHS